MTALDGYDIAETAVPYLAKSVKAGVGFIGRYYGGHRSKDLTLAEARAISQAGLKIVSVFEAGGDNIANFTKAQAVKDGAAALTLAGLCQQPFGTAIYFAVDCDPTPPQLAGNVLPYFATLLGAVGPHYQIGVYGSGNVCTALLHNKTAQRSWLGGAMGWQGSRAFKAALTWDICQGIPGDPYKLGAQVDPDQARTADFGGWSLSPAA